MPPNHSPYLPPYSPTYQYFDALFWGDFRVVRPFNRDIDVDGRLVSGVDQQRNLERFDRPINPP